LKIENSMNRIYLDHAATTYLDPQVVKIMEHYWQKKFGNPSSLYLEGRKAKQAIEDSREKVAEILNCQKEEIYFVGSGTESDNLAILGVACANKNKGNHLITSQIEHHAVLYTFERLEKEGFEVTYLPVDKYGIVDLDTLEKSLRPETILVSVMYANNEIGTIQPINEISKVIRVSRVASHVSPALHTDAAAAAEYLDLDVKKLGVDLMTLGAHKFGGPKGVGALYLKKGIKISPITFGGHHENGLWPGTEAVPLIVGMAEALEIAQNAKRKTQNKVTKLQEKLIKGVLEKIPNTILTGHPTQRLPDIASFCFEGAEGEAILLRLDAEGIAASSGSACTSGDLRPSHVLLATGIPAEVAHGSIRFSLGRNTTEEEIDYVLEKLPRIVKELRKMSPKL